MKELEQKINKIKSILNIKILLEEENSKEIVKSYYRINRLAYKIFHNWKGYLHMGISEGNKYTFTDLEVPLLHIEKIIHEDNATKVLELASGQGANSIFLAKRNPKMKFYAMDLSTRPRKAFYKLKNTQFTFGDFHDLKQYEENYFDIIFIIEALCHSNDKTKVLKEISRILKYNGKLIIYDGYFAKKPNDLSTLEKIACKLISSSMAVGDFANLNELEKQSNQTGYSIIYKEDLGEKVYPTMKRFEKLSSIFFNNKFFGKVIKHVLPEKFIRNSISGYLMPTMLDEGIAVYYRHILEKE